MGNKEMQSNGAFSNNSNIQENNQPEEGKEKEDHRPNTVPFHKLFVFADSKDVVLMVLGTLGAIANGMTWPMTALLLGNMIDAFGGAANKHDVVKRVSKVNFQSIFMSSEVIVNIYCMIIKYPTE